MTLEDLSRQLACRQIAQPRLEALNLLELVTNLSRVKILAGDYRLNVWQKIRLRRLAWRRRRLPLAYLKGEKEFYGRNFHVNPQTLIPRPESEDLISLALEEQKAYGHVYDIGAGSGCLGISYALERSESGLTTHFLDSSRRALDVAQKNCLRLIPGKTEFLLGDIRHLNQPFFRPGSLVFANLPYLDKELRQDFERSCPELKSEPAAALYAAEKGLALYRFLFRLAESQSLTLVCESLTDQQAALDDLAGRSGLRLRNRRNLASLFV